MLTESLESDKSKNLPTVPPSPEGEWSNVAVATVVEEATSVTDRIIQNTGIHRFSILCSEREQANTFPFKI